MADADTVSTQLQIAGFSDVALTRCDRPILTGTDIDEAIELVMALGPAGELLRLAGEDAAHLHGEVDAKLREGLAQYLTPDGVYAPASTWIVAASA